MSIAKGQTFGTTEQVTNTKLHNLVDNATISLEHDEVANNMFTSLASGVGQVRTHMFVTSLASGALVRYDGGTGWYASST